MKYYIWHDEGCCDNTTNDFEEAARWRDEFLAAGRCAYITDADNNVLSVNLETTFSLHQILEAADSLFDEDSRAMTEYGRGVCEAVGRLMLDHAGILSPEALAYFRATG